MGFLPNDPVYDKDKNYKTLRKHMTKGIVDMVRRRSGCHVFVRVKKCETGCV